MQIIADLQLHSKYSRAVSPNMIIPKMYEWNLKKGINLLATGDWTHPLWVRELKLYLEEIGNGLLKIKEDAKKDLAYNKELKHGDPQFLLSGEVSCIYSHKGKTRRNHILLFAQSFDIVEKINKELIKRGCNLSSDGRPILGLSSQEICEVVWGVSKDVLVIPAHAWTPWFSIFGSMSGYDSLKECFGSYAERIYAIETGLSSDPAMNWRVAELDTRTLISCSDSHSGPKIMREATIFAKPGEDGFSFSDISDALKNYNRDVSSAHIAATLEFYPEEGKYHFDGHRNCSVRFDPNETKKKGKICPSCGKAMTIGVLSRVDDLAQRSEEDLQLFKKRLGNLPVFATYSRALPQRAPYVMMIPLLEIISEAVGVGVNSKKVQGIYTMLVSALGGEFTVLFKAGRDEIAKNSSEKVAEGVEKVRNGDIRIVPGYDGVFGTVSIWESDENQEEDKKEQLSLL